MMKTVLGLRHSRGEVGRLQFIFNNLKIWKYLKETQNGRTPRWWIRTCKRGHAEEYMHA